jgi:hypothetical protein
MGKNLFIEYYLKKNRSEMGANASNHPDVTLEGPASSIQTSAPGS